MRLDFHQLFNLDGRPVWINPWQVQAIREVTVDGRPGSRVTFADGSEDQFPVPVGVLVTALLRHLR